jgi:hypothetical protein
MKKLVLPYQLLTTKIATDLFEWRTGQKPIKDEAGNVINAHKVRLSSAARKRRARLALALRRERESLRKDRRKRRQSSRKRSK